MALSLGELAERLDLELIGDASLQISGIANLSDAGEDQLSFLFSDAYIKHLPSCKAGAVVLAREFVEKTKADPVLTLPNFSILVSDKPRYTWARVAEIFDPKPVPSLTKHASAVISPTATCGSNVSIGANVVIEAGARIEANVVIGPGTVVGERCFIGESTVLGANVSLYHDVQIGKHCIVHANAVIGADGFGFEFDGASMSFAKIPQIYAVHIGSNVEIGAGTTIDRGALNHTLVGNGVKLDNQVQIGHGTKIGDHTVISGCTAVAGSTKIGSYCLIGGAVGIIDNIEIVDQVEVTAMSLVSKSIKEKGRYSSGTGLVPSKLWKKNIVVFSKLHDIIKRIQRLERNKP